MILEYFDSCSGGIWNLQRCVVEGFDAYLVEEGIPLDCVYDSVYSFMETTNYSCGTRKRYRSALRRYVEQVIYTVGGVL